MNFWTHYRASRAVIARLWTTYVAWVFFVGLPFALLIFLLATHRDVTERGAFGLPAWMLPVIGFLFMALVMPLTTMLNVTACGGVIPRSETRHGCLRLSSIP